MLYTFFDHLKDEKITAQLEGYVGDLSEHVQNLQAIKDRFASRKIEPWKMKTLEFGIQYYNFLEQRFNEMLLEKNSSEGDSQ